MNTDLNFIILDNTDSASNIMSIDPKKGYSIGTEDHDVEIDGISLNTRFKSSRDTDGSVSALQTNSSTNNSQLIFAQARGTDAAKTPVQTNDQVGDILFSGWDGAAGTPTFVTGARINAAVDDTVSDGVVPMALTIESFNPDAAIDTFSKITASSNGTIALKAGNNVNLTSSTLKINEDGSTFSNNLKIEGDTTAYSGNVVGPSYAPCTTLRVIADEPISVGDVLTASTTTDFRVVKIKALDTDSVGVIGFAVTAAANIGDEIEICGASIVSVFTDALSTVSPGDPIEKSDTIDGRVQNSATSVGTFAISAQGVGVNSALKVWVTANERF